MDWLHCDLVGRLRPKVNNTSYSVVQGRQFINSKSMRPKNNLKIPRFSDMQLCAFPPCQQIYSYMFDTDTALHTEYIQEKRWNTGSVSALSAGAYTVTLLVMVIEWKGVGVQPPPSPARADFSIMMECTPEKLAIATTLCVLCGST